MNRFMRATALPAGLLALAMWASPGFAQRSGGATTNGGSGTTTTGGTGMSTTGSSGTNTTGGTTATINPGLSTTGAYNQSAAANSSPNGSNAVGYGYGVGSYGSVGYGYGMQAAPNSYNPMAANTAGPIGYGYGVGNFGTAGYAPSNNFSPGTGFSYGLSTTTAGPSGYGYGVGTFGTTGYGYGMGNYNRPGLPGFNPYPLGANTSTFALTGPPRSALGIGPNVGGIAGFNSGATGMNGILATQYGPFGLATSTPFGTTTTGTNSQMPGAAASTNNTGTTGTNSQMPAGSTSR